MHPEERAWPLRAVRACYVRAEAFKSLSTRVGAPNAKRPVLGMIMGMISDKKYDFVHGVTENAPA